MFYPNPFDLRHQRSGPNGDLVEQFLSTYGKRATRRSYRSDIQQFFGREPVTRQKAAQVRKEDILAFLKGRADSAKRTTLERKLEAIRSLFRWLDKQNVIEELPISEDHETGDVVEQVLQKSSDTRGGEAGGQREEGRRDTGQDASEPTPDGRASGPPRPGSEVDPGRETAGRENETAPRREESGSSPLRGGPSQDTGHEEQPGSAQSESPPSATSSSEAPPSDTSESEEVSDEDLTEGDTAGGDSAGKDSAGEESAGEKSGGTASDEESPPAPPQWAFSSGEVADVDLQDGEQVALADLPAALRGALRKLEVAGGPEGLFIRATYDLGVRIRYHQGQEPVRVEVTIEHRALRRILRDGTLRNADDPSEQAALREALAHLASRGWALPRGLYDHVGALPAPEEGEGPFSEKRPRWTQEGADDEMIQVYVAAKITGTLTEGFGLEKEHEVLLGL